MDVPDTVEFESLLSWQPSDADRCLDWKSGCDNIGGDERCVVQGMKQRYPCRTIEFPFFIAPVTSCLYKKIEASNSFKILKGYPRSRGINSINVQYTSILYVFHLFNLYDRI